jgi:hypothetical protein
MARSARPPWKRSNPRKRAKKASTHLTPGEKSAARARAKRAGRRYPNLVDNMRMATKKTKSKKRSRKSPKRKAAAKKSARKRSAKKREKARTEKDPQGGLTAAGRKAFARKQGAHLRPGVTKRASEMTPLDMRRKGSWAVRFYGRRKLPPLVDAGGKPTRHALSAHAWGEPVPKTAAAARRIAAKGERLLERYRRTRAKR